MALKKNKFKHNKRRNSGLIYEFLLRKISDSILEKDLKGSKKAFNIIKKYYKKGSPLYEEKVLFDTINQTKEVSDRVANGILKEVSRSARRLNFKTIDIKKSSLLKEINHTFGQSFFSTYVIDDYKALASIQLFINGCNPKSTLMENVQRIELEESLIKFMIYEHSKAQVNEYEQVDELSYRIAVDKFNKRYSDSLNESQKNLLSSYTTSLSSIKNKHKFSKYLNEQRNNLLSFLKKSHKLEEIKSDKLILKKLDIAESILENMSFKNVGSKEVENLMLYCKLVEEITSND